MVTLDVFNYRNEAYNDLLMNLIDNIRVYPTYPNFVAVTREISCATGGTCDLQIFAGTSLGGFPYIILSGASGVSPGFNMAAGTIHVPLNVDWWTNLAFTYYLYWLGFQSYLDANGQATATLNTFAPLPPSAIGLVLHFSYLALAKAWSTPVFASYPVYVFFIP